MGHSYSFVVPTMVHHKNSNFLYTSLLTVFANNILTGEPCNRLICNRSIATVKITDDFQNGKEAITCNHQIDTSL